MEESGAAKYRKFSWFPKFTAALDYLSTDEARELAFAMVEYGAKGEEPIFEKPYLMAIFESVREDIDNSVAQCNNNKGGRPRKPKEAKKREVSKLENGGFSETENGGFSETENPNHTKPSHTKPHQRGEGRMTRPTREEVEREIKAKGYHVDAGAFVDYYDANGWKVGKNPMKSWKSALSTWERREAGRNQPEVDFSRFGPQTVESDAGDWGSSNADFFKR